MKTNHQLCNNNEFCEENMVIKVCNENITNAAEIHSISWKESHKHFCDPKFIELHSIEHQTAYLLNEMNNGKEVYMLIKNKPVGIVSVKDSLIENLYVLPAEQNKGYGTELLEFAISKCADTPSLWILKNNVAAYKLYSKHGFYKTGKKNQLSSNLYEIEMKQKLIKY